MAIFPSSSDYFSKDTDSRSSSTVTTPWTWTSPRTMPSVEVLPLMDKVLTDAPATHHYTHLPFDVRERRQSASSDEDSVVAWRKPRGPSGDVEWRHYARAERESLNTSWKSTTGKQSRFSGLFNQSISDSSNSKESTAMSELGQQCQSSALRQVADISKLDFWWNTQLQSGIEPVTSFMSTGNIGNTNAHECLPQKLLAKPGALANPSSIPASVVPTPLSVPISSPRRRPNLAALVPFLEQSVETTSNSGHTMKQQQKNTGNFLSTFASSSKHNGKPQPRIGPPFMPKSSASTSTTNIIHEILTDEEIKQILAHNWQNPDLNPLTSTEISWLMCLRPGSQSPTSITTAGPAPKSFHHRNVSNDSTLVSLSSSISSSLQTTTTSSPPSSAAATASTTTQQSSEFSNAEAQAQHQREMEIANNKELRARDFANRHAQCQPQSQTPGMPSAAAPSATLSSTSPSSFSSMSLSLSRLPASTATAAPFIPFRDAALVEVAQNTEDIISGIGAQIRDLQRALGNLGSGGNALEGL